MKLKFLGAGAAFTNPALSGNFQSNMVISHKGKNLLIDCGTQVHMSLHEQGLHAHEGDIDAVYISHLHADHIGGMEELGFKTYFFPGIEKPTLFVNRKLSRELWENALQGGMGSIQAMVANLDTYFDVERIDKNGHFMWGGQKFRLVQVIHFMDGFDIVPSYGLIFKVKDRSYFLTTDAQHAPNQIQDFYNMSDVIFQDCETLPLEYASGVHANYYELLELDDETRAKMWLYHYQDGDKPDCVKAGFRGWVVKGQEFELGKE